MLHLLLVDFKSIRNGFRKFKFFDEAKIAIFVFLNLVFLAGIYIGSYRLLAYLNDVQLIGNLIVNKVLIMLFMTSFFMVVFSSLITAFNTIYFSKDLPWLLSTPLSVSAVFAHKTLNTAFYASWMVFAALFPFLLALTNVKEAGFSFFAITMALLVPFFFIASLCGIALNMFMVRLFPARRARDMMLVLGVLFIVGIYMVLRFIEPEKLVRPDGMELVAQYLAFLDAPTAVWLPSWWISSAVFSLLGNNMKIFIFYSSLLAGVSLALFALLTAAADRIFLKGWSDNQSVQKRGRPAPHTFVRGSPARALFMKDVIVFFRDAGQWSQLLILGALSAVYVFSIFKVPLDSMQLQNLIAFFNIGLISFVVSAVALRFVFPAISLEGSSFWILKSSPLTAAQVLITKTLFGGIPVILLATALAVASGLILKADRPVFLASVLVVLIVACGLNSMAAGFGAVFPRFNLTSIAQIETSHGGLFYILAAMFYIGLNIALLGMPMQNYYRIKFGAAGLPWESFIFSGIAFIIINTAAITVPVKLGEIALKRIEI